MQRVMSFMFVSLTWPQTHMHVYTYTYRYLCAVYMNKYTCIYQYVSSRAGGAKGQPLHDCSLTWGGRLHTPRSWTHIYAWINRINVQAHTHIFSMHTIRRYGRQSEEMLPAMIPIVMCASMAQCPVRPSMVQYGSVCPCMVRYLPVWPSMVQYAPAWISTGQYGPVWPGTAQYAPVWLSMI